MAILSRHPGLEVTVEVDGTPLPEYNIDQAYTEGDESRNSTTTDAHIIANENVGNTPASISSADTQVIKYIQSPSSGEFTIRFKCMPEFGYASDHVYLEPSLDGKTISIPDSLYSPQDGCDGQVCYGGVSLQDGSMVSQRFRFTEPIVGVSIL